MNYPVTGSGLGLRRVHLDPLLARVPDEIDFFELAPENWIGVGGRSGKALAALAGQRPVICHGLSLSIGGPAPLDELFLNRLKRFLDDVGARCYSEHLSYSGDEGHLYDLLPLPFTEEAVHYVAGRIRRVQDLLERRIAMENISYYACLPGEMDEAQFINAVLEEADCDLLLDVNNVYVNSFNHRYDAMDFLRAMPAERIVYLHQAGHYQETPDLIIDTHGAEVIDPVWNLLARTYDLFGPVPTLLERDFNIPPLPELLPEVARVAAMQRAAGVGSADEAHVQRAG